MVLLSGLLPLRAAGEEPFGSAAPAEPQLAPLVNFPPELGVIVSKEGVGFALALPFYIALGEVDARGVQPWRLFLQPGLISLLRHAGPPGAGRLQLNSPSTFVRLALDRMVPVTPRLAFGAGASLSTGADANSALPVPGAEVRARFASASWAWNLALQATSPLDTGPTLGLAVSITPW